MNEPNHTEEKKPCACEGDKKTRRDFLLKVGFGLNAVAATMIGVPLVGYVLSTFFKSFTNSWIDLGAVSDFPEGKTRLATFKNPERREWDGETAHIPCWVRRLKGNDFQVFAINCTHLGCPVRWFEESKLFMCPCHGGAFYEDGGHAAGPPPRGLYTYQVKVENDRLMIFGGVLPNLSNPTA